MKNRFLKPVGGLAAVLVLAFCAMQMPARSQTTGLIVSTQVVNSKAASGTSSVLALDGKYSNCSVSFISSDASASITVMGNSIAGQYGPSGPGVINTNFGTNGVIAGTTSLKVSSGNVVNLPVGFYFTWTGNTGTVTAWGTCTSGVSSSVTTTGGSSNTNATIVGPLCGGSVCVNISPAPSPWPQSTPGGIPQVNLTDTTGNAITTFPVTTPSPPNDLCQNPYITKSYAKQLFTTATTQLVVVGVSTKFTHVCSIRISVAAAETISIIQGATGGPCTTPTTIMAYYLQSGIAIPGGQEVYPGTPVASDDLCASTSASGLASVEITYVQQ